MINVYTADTVKSSAHFNLKNIMIPDVQGDFTKLSGKFIYDPSNLDQSLIEAHIDVNTISTGDDFKDKKLKSAEFFDTEKYPEIKFISKKIEIHDEDVLKVSGDLTVKNITKEVVLNVERPESTNKHLSLAASTIVNRGLFGLELSSILEVGEMLVGDDIHITMDITLHKTS